MDTALTVMPWDIDDVLYSFVQYPVDIDLLRVRAVLTQLFFQFFNLIPAFPFDIEVFLIVYGFGKQFVPCYRLPCIEGIDFPYYTLLFVHRALYEFLIVIRQQPFKDILYLPVHRWKHVCISLLSSSLISFRWVLLFGIS